MTLYSQPITIETSLPSETLRQRVREMMASRLPSRTPGRQGVGWKVTERVDGFDLQPTFAKAKRVVRFVGSIEQSGSGSRIVGRVIHPWFTRIATSLFMIVLAITAVRALAQHSNARLTAVWLPVAMIGACVLLLRFELRSTAALIDTGLRAAITAPSTLDAADRVTGRAL